MPTVNIKAFSHKKSTVVENGGPKLPTAAQLELGEIAMNFAKGYETLSIKNNNNEIVTFTNDNYWINKEQAIAAALNDLNDRKQDALGMDEIPTEGSENVVTSGGLYSYITEIEQVTAAALNDLNDKVTSLALSDDYAAAVQGTPPLAGDTYETAISKLHKVIVDDELITSSALNDLNSRIDNLSLSEDYEATDIGYEPESGDTYEAAISKLHGAILENELATSGALNDLNARISDIVVPELILSEDYEPSSLSNEDLFLEPGDSYETAFSKLEKTINDNENITSAALTDLDSRLNSQSLDDIPDGSTRKAVTNAEKTMWNNKSDFSGSYNDLSNKPTTLAGYGITDAINTSSTAQTKAGNLTAAKFIKSGGTSSQFLKADGSVDSNTYAPIASPTFTGTPAAPTAAIGTKTTQIATTAFVDNAVSRNFDEILSRGENLVVNGNGYMMDNTNFISSVFNPLINNSSFGSFEYSTKAAVSSKYKIPLNPSLKYKLSADVKALNTGGSFYGYIDFYDIDGNQIVATNHMWHSDHCTYLTQDLNPGDTVVHINDLSKWNNTHSGHSLSKGITFWNYTNSKGYTYPPYTYTRNVFPNIYGADSDVDVANGVIHLTSAWTGPAMPANTKISRVDSGGSYLYLWVSKVPPTDDWLTCYGFCSGIDYSGSNASGKFPPGTAFGKVGFLVNYGTEGKTWITNISLTTCAQISDIPTNVSQLTNDSGFLIASQLKTINGVSLVGSGNITIQGGGSGEANVIETIKVNGTALTPDSNKAVDITVPSAVTESTVSGWGFTKNSGTITGITMNGASKGTSGVVDLGTVITSETALSKGTTTGNGNAVTDISVSGHQITLTKGTTFLTSHQGIKTLKTDNTTAQSTSSSETIAGSGTINLHKVAKTGTYSDLIGKPTIPAAQVQSDWNATSGMGVILNKPTIPTVNNATLTIQKNGTTVGTFTANASSNVTANIQVNELPTVSSSDNGKILQVVNGAWSLVTPVTVYTGTSAPNSSQGINGDLYVQTS